MPRLPKWREAHPRLKLDIFGTDAVLDLAGDEADAALQKFIVAKTADQAYAKAGAKDKFVLRVQKSTGHSVNGDSFRAAIDWFITWLKP